MTTLLLVIHLLIAITLVAVVLLQRSEGGGLGMGGNLSGGMTLRGTANLLTRVTAVLAGCFMLTSLILGMLASSGRQSTSLLENLSTQESSVPVEGGLEPEDSSGEIPQVPIEP